MQQNPSGFLAHQLLSLSDVLIAATNLFLLQVTAGTFANRIALIRARQAGTRFNENHAPPSSHVPTEPSALPHNSGAATATGVDEQSDYSVAVAIADTGGLELAVVSIWTLLLVVAFKGATAVYVWCKCATRGESERKTCSEARSEGPCSILSTVLRFLGRLRSGISSVSCLPASSSYVCCPGTIAYLYGLWLTTFSLLPVLLGTPLSHYVACVLFASYLASIGLLSPVAAAAVEEIRSLGVEIEAAKGSVPGGGMAHNGLGCGHASGENSSAEGVALSHALSMPKLLQAVHPYLPEVLKKRLPLILSPAQLGHVFTIAAFLPFITCSFCALAACYFLPLDWQTVLVHFPFPVIVGGTVGHFVGAAFSLVLTGFVLPCLSVSRRTLSGGVVATPVLQDLLLRPRQDDDSDWEDFETTERVGCETTHHGSRASGKPSGETEQTESSLRRRGKRNGSPGEIGGLS